MRTRSSAGNRAKRRHSAGWTDEREKKKIMNTTQKKQESFARRKSRVRAKVSGTADRPRLSVFKSHRFIYAQIVDDAGGRTLAAADTRALSGSSPVEKAKSLGAEIAKKAKAANIVKVVFDRGGYAYAGKIKLVAETARANGLEF